MTAKSHSSARQPRDSVPPPNQGSAAKRKRAREAPTQLPRAHRSRTLPWTWLLLLGLVGVIAYGAWSYIHLSNSPTGSSVGGTFGGLSATYGNPATGGQHVLPISQALALAKHDPRATVTVRGQVVDQGPTMGCWVRLRDSSGEIAVQTWPMVYMPQQLRGATVQVTGTLVYGSVAMDATGKEQVVYAPGIQVIKA